MITRVVRDGAAMAFTNRQSYGVADVITQDVTPHVWPGHTGFAAKTLCALEPLFPNPNHFKPKSFVLPLFAFLGLARYLLFALFRIDGLANGYGPFKHQFHDH